MSLRRGKSTRLGERFSRIPLSVLESEAITTLHHAAFRILVILASQYSGRNNGTMALTEVAARRHGFHGRDTLYRSLRELEHRGLIVCTRRGMKVKNSFTLYALGWEDIHNRDGMPLDKPEPRKNRRWLDWKAPPTTGEKKIRTDSRAPTVPMAGSDDPQSIPMNATRIEISIPTAGNTLRISAGSASERAANACASDTRELTRKVTTLVSAMPTLSDNEVARMLSADVADVHAIRDQARLLS